MGYRLTHVRLQAILTSLVMPPNSLFRRGLLWSASRIALGSGSITCDAILASARLSTVEALYGRQVLHNCSLSFLGRKWLTPYRSAFRGARRRRRGSRLRRPSHTPGAGRGGAACICMYCVLLAEIRTPAGRRRKMGQCGSDF